VDKKRGEGGLIHVHPDGMVDIEAAEPFIEPLAGRKIFPDIASNEIEMRRIEIEEIKKQAAKNIIMQKRVSKKF